MNWLARLKKLENAPVPTLQNLQKGDLVAFVGFVGTSPHPFQNSSGEIVALVDGFPCPANDAAAPADDDRFAARLVLFTDHGLNLNDAQAMVHRLADRDSQLDDRRLCLECLHLSGSVTARRCGQWRKTGMKGAPFPADLVTILQRCPGFTHRLKIDR